MLVTDCGMSKFVSSLAFGIESSIVFDLLYSTPSWLLYDGLSADTFTAFSFGNSASAE